MPFGSEAISLTSVTAETLNSRANFLRAMGISFRQHYAVRSERPPFVGKLKLREVVATNDKKRFSFSDDSLRIRANQGHSVEVELGHEPVVPPEVLYHGTVEKSLDLIRQDGLLKGERHQVHLSPDLATAQKVGERRGRRGILGWRWMPATTARSATPIASWSRAWSMSSTKGTPPSSTSASARAQPRMGTTSWRWRRTTSPGRKACCS